MDAFLSHHAAAARHWLVNAAFPLWFENDIDFRGGGFFDKLSLETATSTTDYKRLRGAARQIYVFSRASHLGFSGGRLAVACGLKFIPSKARHPDGGFVSSSDLTSEPTCSDRVTYDLAFVLFAFAHAFRLIRVDGIR